jgi:hypothetical protein
VSNWDNDGYYDDDAWFQAVTYDQTDYQGVDPYLKADPHLEAGRYSEFEVQPVAAPAGQAGGHGADDPGGDPYAGYDDFGYLTDQSAALPEAGAWQPEAAPWQSAAPPWQQPEAGASEQPESDSWPQPQAEPSDQPEASSWPQPPAEPWEQQTRVEEAWSPGGGSDGRPGRPRAPRRSRWLLVGVSAVAAAALGFSVVTLTHRGNHAPPSVTMPSGSTSPRAGDPAPSRPATPVAASQPPITRSQAQQVLASYTSVNNSANAQASQSLLATVEGGGSLAIDSGIYDAQRASRAAGFPPYGPVTASYYIPLEAPAAYPHWFAVRVANARSGKVFNSEYLVFTQAAAGAPWLNSVEPFALPAASLPTVALNSSGYATAVPASGTSLALSPGTVSAATATALDTGTGQPASPGNLADQENLASFSKSLPSHSTVTSRHSASTDPVFGLRTTDGGALLFYAVTARLTLAAPAGGTLHVSIPGFVSSGGQVSQVMLEYLDQFAVTDPPAGGTTPARVIADYSGLTGSAG